MSASSMRKLLNYISFVVDTYEQFGSAAGGRGTSMRAMHLPTQEPPLNVVPDPHWQV